MRAEDTLHITQLPSGTSSLQRERVHLAPLNSRGRCIYTDETTCSTALQQLLGSSSDIWRLKCKVEETDLKWEWRRAREVLFISTSDSKAVSYHLQSAVCVFVKHSECVWTLNVLPSSATWIWKTCPTCVYNLFPSWYLSYKQSNLISLPPPRRLCCLWGFHELVCLSDCQQDGDVLDHEGRTHVDPKEMQMHPPEANLA